MSPSKPAPAEPVTRWSMREVDSEDEPLYDGMETDPQGDWVRWEDITHPPAAPAPAEPVAWLIEDDCNGAGSMRRTYFSAEGEALVHASVRVGCRLVKLYAHPPAAPAEAERLRKALEDAKKRIAPLCGEGTGYSERAEDAMAIIDAALGGREEAP